MCRPIGPAAICSGMGSPEAASETHRPQGSKKKGPLVAAMLKKHETPEHEQDLHLAPGVRQGKRDLEEALETQPDRRGLEARGILKSESGGHPWEGCGCGVRGSVVRYWCCLRMLPPWLQCRFCCSSACR